jgi:NADPH:quinone reductase-like Zn-dependent oxidoreductase
MLKFLSELLPYFAGMRNNNLIGEKSMKAITYSEYGPTDGIRLEEFPKPVPKDDQLLIKVHAASVNRSDWESLVGKPLYARIGGLFRPARGTILGSDVAGVVESVGRNIRQFKPGDEVFGLMMNYGGGFAEYACKSEEALALKPASLTFEQASAIPQAAFIALQGIQDKGRVQRGQKVLINGGGGGAGVFAIQLAKQAGAEVTAVDNAEKLDLMRSMGADHVIDYTKDDFTKNGKQYDLILDLIAQRSVFAYQRALKANGTYFLAGGNVRTMFQILLIGPFIKRFTSKAIRILMVETDSKDLVHITQLIEARTIKLVIDKTFPISKTAEALRYLGEGHAKGKIVIKVSS